MDIRIFIGMPLRYAKSVLQEKNIPFETITDVDVMTSKGLSSAPALEIEGKLYNFKDSINWVNSQE